MNNHDEAHSTYNRLRITLVITLLVLVAEVIGGIYSGSLALLGDAGHMLVDVLAILLSLFAMIIARRPATATKTFGYHRMEILAALANGTILILVSCFIFYKAYQRFLAPPEVKTSLMLAVAVIGLCANIGGVMLLSRASHRSLNIRAAFWHIIGDAISSVGVIIAGIVILFTGWRVADTIAAIVIGGIILWGAGKVVIEAVDVLLEAVPRQINTARLVDSIRNVPGVNEVHDIHVWTITSDIYAMSAHLVIDDQMVSRSVDIVRAVKEDLERYFNISHTTLQLECESCPTGITCEIDRNNHSAK